MAEIVIGNTKVHYQYAGVGKTIILLHGWNQNLEMMNPILEHLKSKFTVYNLDLPGFGKSSEPDSVWGPYEYSEMLETFIDKLNIDNPIIIGHSYGGRIAIVYASKHPNCKKIVLCDSAGIMPKRQLDYYLKVYSYKIMKRLGIKKNNSGSIDYQQASPMMRKILVKSVNLDLEPLLNKIKASTLIVWGESDEATPIWMGKKMNELIKDSGLVVFEDAGHFAYYEQLPRFLTILDVFFNEEVK